MDKSGVTDDLAVLSRRFQDLIDKVQGIMDELSEAIPSLEDRFASSSLKRAYTIEAIRNKKIGNQRSKALIRVVEEALKELDIAMGSAPDHPASNPCRSSSQKISSLFTMEELHFLQQSFAAFSIEDRKNISS